jgi:hypothetical protein
VIAPATEVDVVRVTAPVLKGAVPLPAGYEGATGATGEAEVLLLTGTGATGALLGTTTDAEE